MQFGVAQNVIRGNPFFRGVANLLVIFPFVDLTVIDLGFPQLCGDNLMTMRTIDSSQDASLSVTPASDQDQESHSECIEEDCFCCSAQIVPGAPMSVAALGARSFITEAHPASLPTTPPQSTFHPPRLS